MSWRRVMPSPVARQAPRSLCSPLGSKHRGAGWPGEGHLAWKTHPQHIESSFQMTKNKRRQRTQQPDLQITIAPASNNTSNNRSSALISASTNSSDNEIYENTLSSPLFTTKPSEQPKPRNSLHPDTIKLTPTSIPRSSASAAASASSDDHSIHDDQSLADEQQQQEDLENHLDQAEEYSPQDENSHWQHTARSDDDDDQDDDQDDRDGRSNGSENGEREPLVHHSHHDQPISEGSYSSSDNPRLDGYPRHSKARQRRKVYGGGRLDWGGELEIWEVGLGVASNILSPAPLFIPHAFLLLGLPIGLPVLFLIGFVAWFSQVVLVVCGRYVGGRTYAQVASAVLPDRLKGCNIWFGETVVELCRVFVAGGRGMVNMMMVSDLFSQLTRQYTPKAAILYSRVFIIAFVGLLSLLPNFLRPRRPLFLPALFPTLSRLPLLLTALWPIAIGIIAFRLRQLNRELGRKLPPTGEGDVYSEIMGGTVWGGFSILLFCLSTPQHTFKHFRSLKRINKPPGNTTHPMRPLASHSAEDGSAVPVADPLFAGTSRSSIFSSYTLRRYSWESAALLGVVYSTLICLSWGLVGYLGMEHGGYEVNFLASLPSNDPWISSSRVILLVVLIPSIPLSLRPATTALFHLMRIPGVIHTASSRRKKLRRRGERAGRRMEAEWDDEDEDEPLAGTKAWMARLVTTAIWLAVAIGAIRLGGSNGGEGSTIEVLGCVGSTIIAGLIPSVFWIVLFHIRKARPILNINPSNPPSPTASISRTIDNPVRPGARSRIASNSPLPVSARRPSGADQLLIIKEAQLQKRLSGRRIWQDIGIFGILIPFCSVVLLKGLIAVSHETGPPPPIS
ncbi:hypothetical protein PTTG_05835 [Puccinia triticina 1-1 BBBD Race 1]|uniref:Aa_trans domain-containing protein n=1 Tax=Puccinia triticina (isolate 1-1 / race 1 (BBBD)) TaxID=630390 RepID=A0A180GAA0_PUCT1|nr:hypothetical protein PTTG_05835 [Puccinia triticina 1-1 BBBD Race 1]